MLTEINKPQPMSQQTIMSVTEWQKANRYTVNSSKEKEMKAYAEYYHREKSKGVEDLLNECIVALNWSSGNYKLTERIKQWLTQYKNNKKS